MHVMMSKTHISRARKEKKVDDQRYVLKTRRGSSMLSKEKLNKKDKQTRTTKDNHTNSREEERIND